MNLKKNLILSLLFTIVHSLSLSLSLKNYKFESFATNHTATNNCDTKTHLHMFQYFFFFLQRWFIRPHVKIWYLIFLFRVRPFHLKIMNEDNTCIYTYDSSIRFDLARTNVMFHDYIQTFIHTYIYTNIHAYKQKYIHTYIHR